MAKVEGSYESVVRGVSQQVPHQRFSGQHTNQVNLLSDAVEGLVRRRGTRLMSENPTFTNMTQAQIDVVQAYRTHIWSPGAGMDPIQLAYKKKNTGSNDGKVMYAINQRTKAGIDIVTLGGIPAGSAMEDLYKRGVSAITSIGRYTFMATNGSICTMTAVDTYRAPTNRNKVVAWVRGGAYARTYTVTLLLDNGGMLRFWYKTMAQAYPTPIVTPTDTSAPDYQSRLSKVVADYNSATTKWISDASRDIQAENIAIRLVNGPEGAVPPATVAPAGTNTGTGNSLLYAQNQASGVNKVVNLKWYIRNSTIYIQGDNIREIVVDDGGDTTLIRGVGNEISSADLVSVKHFDGKIIKVRATKSDNSDAYYLQANLKTDTMDPSTWSSSSGAPNTTGDRTASSGEVVWKEAAGYVQSLSQLFMYAYYHTDGKIYLASHLSEIETTLGVTTPKVVPNGAGDDFTNPPPNFVGKSITYLGLFQDRLVVGSGAVASFSRPGDYLNFFRQSVLTLTDTDPIDMYALGSEDDTLRHSALFDKSLFLFGERRQYVVNGRTVLTPTNQNMTVISSFPNTTGAEPKGSGNFIFYTKPGDTTQPVITLNQMQYGQIADSTESYDLSQQLTDFCTGVCAEIIPVTSPSAVIIRPESGQKLYIFRYTDEVGTGRRLQAAWDQWEFHPAYGRIISIGVYGDEILAMVLRATASGTAYLHVEQLSLRPSKEPEAYHDSYQPCTGVGNSLAFSSIWLNQTPAVRDLCFFSVKGGSHHLTGTSYPKRAQLTAAQIADGTVVGGIPFESHVTPTNPYQRDQQGNAILYGRLTLTSVLISTQETAAMDVYVKDANREWLSKHFNGFLLSRVASRIGSQPVTSHQLSALVGREIRECDYTIRSVDYLPMTVTAISWTGQSFRR